METNQASKRQAAWIRDARLVQKTIEKDLQARKVARDALQRSIENSKVSFIVAITRCRGAYEFRPRKRPEFCKGFFLNYRLTLLIIVRQTSL